MSEGAYRYPGEYLYKGKIYHERCPSSVLQTIEHDLQLPQDTVIVSTYPKSGTSWTLELLYQLQYGTSRRREAVGGLKGVYPYLESLMPDGTVGVVRDTQVGRHHKGLKTHLDASFFQRQLSDDTNSNRFIVMTRDPKDVLVSFFHFHKACQYFGFQRSFDHFYDMFRNDKMIYGNSLDHVLSWWHYKDHPNVLILNYEEMLTDQVETILSVARFLGYKLPPEEVTRIQDAINMSSMRTRGYKEYLLNEIDESVSPYFRKGTMGDWRSYMTEEQSNFIDGLVRDKLNSKCFFFRNTVQ